MKLTMKRFLLFVVAFLFINSISVNVFAEPIKSATNLFYADDNINEVLEGESDVYAAGYSISFKGNVASDVVAAGNTVNINLESIGGSVRVAGASVNIESQIDRNITVIAGSINIKESTKAKGVYVFGSDVKVLGESEDLYVSGDKVTLDGIVTGNVKVECSELIIGENARVDGTVEVKSEKEPVILGGFDVNKIEFERIINHNENDFSFAGISIISKVISLITAILLVVLITLLCKKYILKSYARLEYKPWLPFVIGFASLIVVPIVSIIICFTIIAIPISVISIIIYGVLIYLAYIISGIVLGRILLKGMNAYLSGILCTVIIKVVAMIPYVGGVLTFICILLSLGLFVQNLFGLITEKEV